MEYVRRRKRLNYFLILEKSIKKYYNHTLRENNKF